MFLAFFFFLRFVCGGRFIFMRRERIFNFTSNLQAPFLSNGTISPSIQTSSLTLARNTFITVWKYGPIPLLPCLFLFPPVRLHGAYRRHRLRLTRRRGLNVPVRRYPPGLSLRYRPLVDTAFTLAARPRIACVKPADESSCCKNCNNYHGRRGVLIHGANPPLPAVPADTQAPVRP